MCYALSPGCRGTVYQTTDLKKSTGRTYLNKLYLTSHVSCKNSAISLSSFFLLFLHFHGLMLCHVLLSLFICVSCFVWSSSIARGGHSGGTVAGMPACVSGVKLCKCPPYIYHQTIKIALQPSITILLSRLSLYCLRVGENHLKLLVNRTRPKQN